MKRPSISLAMILKNEAHHLPELLKSVEGCFDEIHITDTGSTDGTVELAKSLGCHVHHFDWVNDFSAARNASFKPVTTDFVMWMDGDDLLVNKEAFIRFRDDAMGLADYWVATYHYASDASGVPMCSFARERVFRTSLGLQWKYFVHEGVVPQSSRGQVRTQYIPTWSIKHIRTEGDLVADRSRNLKLFESHKDQLDPRMQYYYGKELFESGNHVDACAWLMKAISQESLELHDRTLGLQYACYSYMSCNQFEKAIQLGLQGIQLTPNRAEFHVLVGDCWLKMGRLIDAIPFYTAAKGCTDQIPMDRGFAGAIFSHKDCYTVYPRNQLARIYAHMGDFSKAEAELVDCMKIKINDETNKLLEEVTRIKNLTQIKTDAKTCDDIVISSPPVGLYLWDGDVIKKRGVGGSETAAIKMAYELHKNTGRPVKVFNQRDTDIVCDGVEYISASKITQYFSENKPFVHIAWRHNTKLTDSPTLFWCHDLLAHNGEQTGIYDNLLCLSPFHSRYIQAMQGIPEEKIRITRNGIDTDIWNPKLITHKNPYKIVFPSSPDRGLDRVMRILDKARETYPQIELHSFYGFDNMRKSGPQMIALADRLETMMKERPWVKFHGNTEQKELADHLREASVFVYPADFIESHCSTIHEMRASGVYMIARKIGALQDTMKEAADLGMAEYIDHDCVTELEYQAYADAVVCAIREKKWEKVSVDIERFSWKTIAEEWVRDLFPPTSDPLKAVS